MKKVLFLSYYFPPMGGAGVQRIAKFCKYLPLFGYHPVVVAAKTDPSIKTVDHTLLHEVQDIPRYDIDLESGHSGLQKFSHNKFGRLLNLSHAHLANAALRAGELAIQKENPDVICASVSPFPMADAAETLAAKYQLPWILDMRDPWALDPINYYTTKLHYWADMRTMRNACQRASAVIMNTPDSLDVARKSFEEIEPDKFTCITNGWDADDFKSFNFPRFFCHHQRPLTIVHTGAFPTRYAAVVNPSARMDFNNNGKKIKDWFKYSIGKPNLLTRTPHYLFQAIASLIKEKKISKADIRLILAGASTPEDIRLAEIHDVSDMVEFRGYLNHRLSVQTLNQADVLFLPLHEPDGMLPLIVPGKTYEYLAAQRPILATVPKGDARCFVEMAGLGYVCEPTHVDQIAATLLELVERFKSPPGIQIKPDKHFINKFERKKLTEQLALLLDAVMEKRYPS